VREPHLSSQKNRRNVSTKRKILVWCIVAVATVLLLITSLTVWTKRQLLSTNGWTKTSGQLLANDTVRSAVSAKLVQALFQRVDVAGELEQKLPDQLQAAAPVLAGALENVAPRAASALLGTDAAQTLWEVANRRMHMQLAAVLKGEKVRNVQTENGDVVLDLRPLIHRLADRLGIEDTLKANASPTAGQIVILHSDQLEAAQKAVRVVKALSIFILIAVLALYALALYLARPSRRKVLGGIGGGIFGVGLLLLILQRLLGNAIIDNVVKVDANKPSGHEIWQIVTSELRDVGIALVVYGLVAIAGAILAGPNRVGTTVRRWLAPAFRRNVVVVYAVVVAILLILVAWAPLASDRRLLGTLVLFALILWGIELLRRQTLREFPASPAAAPPPAARPT
jgi:hypothetical protein